MSIFIRCILIILICFSFNRLRAETKIDVDIISSYSQSSPATHILLTAVQELNKHDSEYTYRVVSAPGANGKIAIDKYKANSDSKKQISVLYSDIEILKLNNEDVSKYSNVNLWSYHFYVCVSEKSPIDTFEDLISYLKSNKKQTYFYGLPEGGTSAGVNIITSLKNHYHLDKVEIVKYKTLFDLQSAVLRNEIDFIPQASIPSALQGLKPILSTAKTRSINFSKIPTGKELNIQNFIFSANVSFIFQEKENEVKIKNISKWILNNEVVIDLIQKNGMIPDA